MTGPCRDKFARRLAGACLGLAALGLLAVPGCGRADAPTAATDERPKQGGTIVVGSRSDVDSWNEYRSQQSFANTLLRRIFLRLAREPASPDKWPEDYTPLLAESWTTSPDGLALTFKLREALWSDGTPISADDVRFTWEAQVSPDVAWVGAGTKDHITDVEVIDPRTVIFHFDQAYPYQLADVVDGGILPRHVFGQVPFDQWATHDWSVYSIGSGPYLLESHRPALETVLKRNPRYFDVAHPLADRVVVRYVPDVGNLLTQLRAGEIDFLDGVPPREAHRLASNADLTLLPYDYPGYDYLGWNGSRPPFDDVEMRRAMTLAIDREALVEDLLFGLGKVSSGPVPSSWWGATADQQPLPHDPAEAMRLLAERGYAVPAGEGGMPAGGRRLEVELLTNNGNRIREEMLVKIQEQLSRVGVQATVRPLEMRAMRGQIVSGDYDGYLGGWIFVGRVELGVFFGTGAPYNVVAYSSVETDRLLEEVSASTSWETIEPLLHDLQRQLHDDQPYTFLYEKQRIAAHGPRLGGVEIELPADPLDGLERFWVK